jgi:hypothetical protein
MPKVDDEVFTEEEFEKRLQWSSLGGTVATAKGVHALLLKEAGDHYACGRDDIASAFRLFARDYDIKVVNPQSAELQKFINGEK